MQNDWTLLNNEIGLIDIIELELKSIVTKFKGSDQYRTIVAKAEKKKHDFMKKIGPCYFQGCANKSVRKSHSISNRLMLEPIAENGRLMSPVLDGFTGSYKAEILGLKKATIFPGFCQEHENAFLFEKEGLIKTDLELQKHLFRTICYQLHFLKSELIKLELAESLFYDHFVPIFKEKIDRNKLKSDKTELVRYFSSCMLPDYELKSKQLKSDIAFLTENWYGPHFESFGSGLPEGFYSEIIGCTVLNKIAVSCPVFFPNSPYDKNGMPDFRFEYFVMVFPNNGTTHIYLVCLSEQQEELVNLAELFERAGDRTTDYIFDLIKSKTENWFLAPSTWSKLTLDGQQYILKSLGRIV